MKNSNLKSVVDLLHDIGQSDYHVQFCGDFNSMLRIEFRNEWDESFYEHEHLGFPGCERSVLERRIVESLSRFLEKVKGIENEKK